MVPTQQHAHQARAPGGVGAAQLYGLLDQSPERRRVRVRSAGVRRGEGVGAVLAEALHQLSDGAGNEAQGTGNEARALTLFGSLDDHLTHGHRDRMWHEHSSLKCSRVLLRTLVFLAGLPAKPEVGMGRQNLVSGLGGKTWCRD
jgi:hypothetical protein